MVNAAMHSGRDMREAVETAAKTAAKTAGAELVEVVIAMLATGRIDTTEFLATIGVGLDGYVVTEEIAMKALKAKNGEKIGAATFIRILDE
jgi:integrase